MLYPDNLEIKLYLLSVLVSADSPNKALTVIEEIKTSEDVTAEDLVIVNEIEEEMKARGFKPDSSRKFPKEVFPKELYNDWLPSFNEQKIIRERLAQKIAMKPNWYRKTKGI